MAIYIRVFDDVCPIMIHLKLIILLFFVGASHAEFNGSPYAGEAPWNVLVLVRNNSSNAQCSGTAIGDHTVLTAAHFVVGFESAVVYSSPAVGGVDSKCLQRRTPYGSLLFKKEAIIFLNEILAPCNVTAYAVVSTAIARGASPWRNPHYAPGNEFDSAPLDAPAQVGRTWRSCV